MAGTTWAGQRPARPAHAPWSQWSRRMVPDSDGPHGRL